MKKLLLLLLCVPLIGLGQLEDYYISEGNPKTHGLDFKIKKPIGYTQFSGKIPTTIVGFSRINNKVLTEFYISVYTLEQAGLEGDEKY